MSQTKPNRSESGAQSASSICRRNTSCVPSKHSSDFIGDAPASRPTTTRVARPNLDDIVNYEAAYSAEIKKAKRRGETLLGCCPFHADSSPSFSVNLKTGQWKCFVGCGEGNYLDFYARIHNVTTKDAYKAILDENGYTQSSQPRQKSKPKLGAYTAEQYAEDKHLPLQFLQVECGVETGEYGRERIPYVKIPYYDIDGKELSYRQRFANKDMRWRQGTKIEWLYGEWQIKTFQQYNGCAILVEGESDTQSLWHMGLPALGVPGAAAFKSEVVARLKGLNLYIHQEPDAAGAEFVARVRRTLFDEGFEGKLYSFQCHDIDGLKDPSDVLIAHGKDEGAELIKRLIGTAEEIDLRVPEEIEPVIPNQPVALLQPSGWMFNSDGIFKQSEKTGAYERICKTPIIITRRIRNIETEDEKFEVAFYVRRRWVKRMYPRSTIYTARSVTVLTDEGCMINSENARDVVKFLLALEEANDEIIQTADSTSSFGWQPDGRFIPGNERNIVLDIDKSMGDISAAYSKEGNIEDWIECMRPHRERDVFRFILASAFAAPLLRILHQRGFFVYNWGDSRGGKTAALKAALSAWGDPDGLMITFNTTQVGLERRAALYCDLPLGIDERQLAGTNQDLLDKVIYMVSSGVGKIRGSKLGGLQETQTWRTIALSTGEEPLQGGASMTGTHTRVIELEGSPFESEADAADMHYEVSQSHGWAGAIYIARLCCTPDQAIKEAYELIAKYVKEQAAEHSAAQATGIAIIALADAFIEELFFRGAYKQDLKPLGLSRASLERAESMARNIVSVQNDAASEDVNTKAVEALCDWINGNKATNFQGGINARVTQYGEIDEAEGVVYIYPHFADKFLTDNGFNPRKTFKHLKERNFLKTSLEGKLRFRKRINGERTQVYAFKMKEYLEGCGGTATEELWEEITNPDNTVF